MTPDDIRLAVEELHDSILDWVYETSCAGTLDEEQSRHALRELADSLHTMPPGWWDEWAYSVEHRREYIDRAITLLRAAQHASPARAAAALRNYLEEIA